METARITDLRSYLQALEQAGELARVRVPVSLNQEIGAVCLRNLRANGPGLLFEHPGAGAIPLAVDLLASRRRYALALEVEPEELAAEWSRRASHPLPPVVVERGACQQNVRLGKEVDLTILPVPIWNELDGGPYLTLSCHITKDPVTKARNVGLYRNQLHDRQTLGILAAPYTHLNLQRNKAPGEPFPVAIAIGADPTVVMTAPAPLPLGTDELAIAGALRGKPLELVRCKTIPLEVPASAEIVIEGEISPDELREEGPFGEFTGHYGGHRAPRPVIRVKAITYRDNPILQASYEGMQPNESGFLTGVPREAELMRQITFPGIKKIHVSAPAGGALHAVVAVEKPYEGFGKYVGLAVLGSVAGRYVKRVVIVDADIDPFDPIQVEWAIATRVQANRDVEILTELTGILLDPSLPKAEQAGPSRTSKMIIDATRYDAKTFPPVCSPSAEAMAKVEREWAGYGIRLKSV
ncbi:MAG TPA: UbiD family decarboxylase [Candidatus Binatia bacterium]|jgi:UbiD family decarboxylase